MINVFRVGDETPLTVVRRGQRIRGEAAGDAAGWPARRTLVRRRRDSTSSGSRS